jgi:hypothetical protein
MKMLFERLMRLWELSSPDIELISRAEYGMLMAALAENKRETRDTNERVTDWIGVLMKSELLRRELEEKKGTADGLEPSMH